MRWLGLLGPLWLCACSVPARSPAPPPDLKSPFAGYESARYRESRWWLCLPGREGDACAGNLDATEVRPDGTRVEVRDRKGPGADLVDCFYVYPTVDLRPWPASHENFASLRWETMATVHQAARLRAACRVFVPLYRQTTIGTYLRPGSREPYRAVAESDVVDAFLHYMGQYNRGRKVVLLGHSQGGEMTVALLQRLFDHDPVMRERLLLAMPIGWPVEVPPGQTTGGTFDTIPVCTKRGETGCVVAFRTYGADHAAEPGHALPSKGKESVCVNPAELAHGTDVLSRALFGVPAWFGLPDWAVRFEGDATIETPFVMLRDFYRATCVSGNDGFRYLAVQATPRDGDARESPFDLGSPWFRGQLGTHVLDMQLTAGDLFDLVVERSSAVAGAR